MTTEPLYSLKEAAEKLDAYPRLLRMLIHRFRVPHRIVGGLMILDESGVELLRPHVQDWKNRPRVTDPTHAAAS